MMKKIFLGVFVLLMAINVSGQEINWMTFEEAIALQKKTPKKIMVDMYTVWCGPCKMLDRDTFKNEDVAKYVNEHYYAVKFNAEGNEEVNFKGEVFTNPQYDPAKAKRRNAPHQLSRYFSIRSYPTILFLDEEANFITPVVGYKTPQQLEVFLTIFKDNKYKEIKTQKAFNDYYESFKPTFSETK
jgi:thioredoxin-related protein